MTPDKRPHHPPASTDGRRVFIKSYGCQMNIYDSQRMADALAPEGFVETASMGDADLVILNTCHIREKAAEKVYSELGRVRLARDERRATGSDMTIAVAGCVAQAEGRGDPAPGTGRRPGPRAADLSPPARSRAGRRGAARRGRHGVSRRGQVRDPAPGAAGADAGPRAGRLRDRAGGLRQVLHLLRGALYEGRRSVAAGRSHRRRGGGARRGRRAGGLSARAERQCLSRGDGRRVRGLARDAPAAAGENRGDRPAALHDVASTRHGRRRWSRRMARSRS